MSEHDDLFRKVLDLIDGACWRARGQYGHDDNGLYSGGVNALGVEVDECDDGFHPSAHDATVEILKLLETQ